MPIFRHANRPRPNKHKGGAGRTLTAGSHTTQIAWDKTRLPLQSLRDRGIITVNDDGTTPNTEEEQARLRAICRLYAKYHDLIPIILEVYARFPLQGMRIVCNTPQHEDAFKQQFFDILDYPNYLAQLGLEYFTVGEATSFAVWDQTAGMFTSEQILNPDSVHVTAGALVGDEEVTWDLPEEIIEAAQAGDQPIEEAFPGITDAAREGRPVHLSTSGTYRLVNRAAPWDLRGTPILTRVLRPLQLQESLNAAQDAIADRLYNPLILAKIGVPAGDLGKDAPSAWIPSQEELDAFTDQMNQAFAADFRMLAYSFGVDIKNVFGREAMPNFDKDIDRIETQILRAFGLGRNILEGSGAGPYASGAINRDFVSNMMQQYQDQVRALFKKRARQFAQARGLYEIETDNEGNETIITETVAIPNQTGDGWDTIEQPVLCVPDLDFASNPMKDNTAELNLLTQLRNAGVPISAEALVRAAGADLDVADELARRESEQVEQQVSEASIKTRVERALTEEESDVSQEEAEQAQQARDGGGDVPLGEPESYSPSAESNQ